jgi:hypothetical protein
MQSKVSEHQEYINTKLDKIFMPLGESIKQTKPDDLVSQLSFIRVDKLHPELVKRTIR